MVRTLMELGADVNQAMDGGATPLFMVAHMGHADPHRFRPMLIYWLCKGFNPRGFPLKSRGCNRDGVRVERKRRFFSVKRDTPVVVAYEARRHALRGF
jgi:hypothetical protein